MLFWKVQKDPFSEARTSRRSLPIFLTLLLAALLYYGFSEITYFLYTKLYDLIEAQVAYYKIDAESPIFYDLGAIIRSSATVLLALFAVLYVRFLEGRRLSSMLFHKEKLLRDLGKGVLTGAALFAAMLGILVFTGCYRFEGELRSDFLTRAAGIFSVLLCGISFEYFFRGFLLSSLGARCNKIVAVLLAAVLSTAAQSYYWGYSFISVFNNLLFNFLLGLLVLRTGSAWTACAARASFLFVCQFVFGTVYSGIAYTHALIPTTADYTNSWAGTANGIDNGYTFAVVLAAAILLALFLPQKAPEEEWENGPFFKHVPVEKQPAQQELPSKPAEQASAPVLKRPESPAKQPETPPAPQDEDDEVWEEEEARAHVEPDYKKPEDYLK